MQRQDHQCSSKIRICCEGNILAIKHNKRLLLLWITVLDAAVSW